MVAAAAGVIVVVVVVVMLRGAAGAGAAAAAAGAAAAHRDTALSKLCPILTVFPQRRFGSLCAISITTCAV